LTACKSNLKNIGTALELYSSDNGGRFPSTLAVLVPNMLKSLPTCPAAGRVTYAYVSHHEPDAYTLACGGGSHEDVGTPSNFPQYSSVQGLIER
jgi:hypothetical protein